MILVVSYVPTSKTEQARLAALTPAQYAVELNVSTRRWLDRNPTGWAGFVSENPADLTEYASGLAMAFEYKRAEYSDAFKSTYGMRPRHTYFDSLTACEEALEDLYEEASESLSSERWWEMAEGAHRAAEATQAANVAAAVQRAHEERWMNRAAACGACGW